MTWKHTVWHISSSDLGRKRLKQPLDKNSINIFASLPEKDDKKEKKNKKSVKTEGFACLTSFHKLVSCQDKNIMWIYGREPLLVSLGFLHVDI